MTLQSRLKISPAKLDDINNILLNPDMEVITDFLEVVAKYGTPEEINAKANKARKLENLLALVKKTNPSHLEDLEWLQKQRDKGAFISVKDYRKKILGEKADEMVFADDFAVTLEISACQYFHYVRMITKAAIEHQMLMPGRFIRVRKMKEQEEDGDLAAFSAAMQIIGGSFLPGILAVLGSPTSMP